MANTNKSTLDIGKGIRKRVLAYCIENRGANLSQACSGGEILAVIYNDVLHITGVRAPLTPQYFPGSPSRENKEYFTGQAYNGEEGPEYDKFYFSPSQYSIALYACLMETGRMADNGMEYFSKPGNVMEQIGEAHSPGMDILGGSLGQCISQAAGVALARKLGGETGRCVIFLGDGECESGQTWECIQASVSYKLDNMIIFVDQNGQQCDGRIMDQVNGISLEDRFRAFGCRTYVVDGHDPEAMAAIAQQKPDGRPMVLLCQTKPYHGIESLKSHGPRYHYIRFDSEKEVEMYREFLKTM